MIFKTIMVHLDVDSAAGPRLAYAQKIARKFGADVVAVVAAEAGGFVPRGISGQALTELIKSQSREIGDRFDTLREEFLSLMGTNQRDSWRAEMGNPTEIMALHARTADLIVSGAPTVAARGDIRRTVDRGELILSAGRPVLFAADDLAPLRGERVLVAWKDTREARRAVADAMPFLRQAHEVTVAAAAESDHHAVRDGATDVIRFLMKHGVNARPLVVEYEGPDTGGLLMAKADEVGADLVVAGGYGHSRLREWTFGGVTRTLLSSGSLHRLFSN